ncbi:MAG: hypothetical protein IH948_05400 [Bacteroidetes bacterium]|nr:hypothetical protein [Bacteroidota bacterium]
MRINKFAKSLLLLIVLFLGLIALRPFFFNDIVHAEPGSYDYVKTMGTTLFGAIIVLDSRNGKIWVYNLDKRPSQPSYYGQIIELGKPLRIEAK